MRTVATTESNDPRSAQSFGLDADGEQVNTLAVAETVAWLDTDPPLNELRERFPKEWAQVERDVAVVLSKQDESELAVLAERASRPMKLAQVKGRRGAELVSDASVRRSRMSRQEVATSAGVR